jgi:hypothetical protein
MHKNIEEFIRDDGDHQGGECNLREISNIQRLIELDIRAGHYELAMLTCERLVDTALMYMRKALEAERREGVHD